MEPRVEVSNLTMRYPDGKGGVKTVLNNVSLKVSPGEFVTVVGPSGCGKSTLLRMILGSESPTQGTVRVNGVPVKRVTRDRGIVFQKYSLFPHLTVLENIIFGLELENMNLLQHYVRWIFYRKRYKEFRAKAEELLTRIEFRPEDGRKHPNKLSGGMQQRVAIAQAMAMQPEVLMMDEPFGALDVETREKMQLFLLEFWRKHKMTIFFVTHDLEEALFLGTRVVVLSQHWEDDKGHGEGAKIVIDKALPVAKPDSTELKYSEEFNRLHQQIRDSGLSAKSKKHVKDFDLSHPDAWKMDQHKYHFDHIAERTVDPKVIEELRKKEGP